MDAQHAAGPDKTKPPASPGRSGPRSAEHAEPAVSYASKPSEAPVANSSRSPVAQSRPSPKAKPSPARHDSDDGAVAADRDSDAETIVLPGKDGHSPSKARKVKHEDTSDGETHNALTSREDWSSKGGQGEKDSSPAGDAGSAPPKKKSRVGKDSAPRDRPSKTQEGSSGLSSAPSSPRNQRRRLAGGHDSDSDAERRRPPQLAATARAKSVDHPSSNKRKASRAGSDHDEAGDRKAARRRRIEEHPAWLSSKDRKSASRDSRGGHKEESLLSAKRDDDGKNRSVSPPVRAHRRSISTTHLPSSSSANGLSNKKKRLPPPLRSTEDHSDESSAGGSPHPRNSNKVRNLSTPATAESNVSPAKMPLGKKHVDAHGQTPLARACNKGEYDVAKQRLTERPEDLDVADYAGNTPLQSAALKGFDDIVKLLIDAGCNVDSFNSSRDTPLIDAVDNGHLDVIKLLLAAGANPRKANLSGEEPLDRVSDQLDNAEEIRAALSEAKLRHAEVRRTSEDIHPGDHQDGRSSHGADSPRHSPVPAHLGRRPGTVRSTKTGNHHLYVNLDEKTLRAAAAKGDEETVTRVLQVKDRYDDPEAMVAAARGGHEVVIQLLLALGGADPDPAPVPGMQSEFSTPMLAAIGQENINVIQLLLSQQNFDPTRRYKGATYYEIAQRRQGSNWKEEEQLLKKSYDTFKKSHRDGHKTKSPGRRERARALERDAAKQAARKELKEAKEKEEVRPRRKLSDASRDSERKKPSSSRPNNSPKEKRRSDSFSQRDNQTSPKRAPGRLKQQEDRPLSTISDREASPALSHKSAPKPKRNDSDFAALSSEGESVKPRRKLVSKGELRGEREKQRRASLVSNASSSVKDPPSPRDPKQDENADKSKELVSEKYHDRTKALKRDESRERHAMSGDAPTKRHRSSTTPPQPSNVETDSAEAPAKRRRLDVEGKERRTKPPDSNDDRPKAPREGSTKLKEGDAKASTSSKTTLADASQRTEDLKSIAIDKTSIQVKSEDADVDMPDAVPSKEADEAVSRTLGEREAAESAAAAAAEAAAAAKKREDAEAEAEEIRLKEKEKQQREAEEKQRKDEEAAKQREVEIKLREEEDKRRRQEEETEQRKMEEEKKRRAEEDKQREVEEEKKRQAEQQKRLEEEERARREAEERKQREEEARRLREEEERRQKEEEERKRLEEEERQRKAEEERRQREEEERLRKAQLEREAAEEARRKREDEERKEREHRERLKREEAERKRAAHEAEMRRLREEHERQQRLANLPPLLQWLDTCPNPQIPELAKRFRRLVGVRYDTIRPETTGTPEGREQWVLNVQAALLLGVKDLGLARYTGWSRVPASHHGKLAIWRLEQDHFALTSKDDFDLGLQLSNLYGSEEDPQKNGKISFQAMVRLRNQARDKFLSMDMFFVKLSDLMFIVPTFPHLRNTEVIVNYCEIRETSSSSPYVPKWKQDPGVERFHGFAPMNKYYVNGTMVKEQLPGMSPTSKTPFPELRVPRRGLQQVYPDDPQYAQLCQQQGLEHLLKGASSPTLPNGVHPSPPMSHESLPETNDRSHSDGDTTAARAPLTAEAQQHQNGPNGVKGVGHT